MNNAFSSIKLELGAHLWIVALGLVLGGLLASVWLVFRWAAQPPPWKDSARLLVQKACPNRFLVSVLSVTFCLLALLAAARQIAGAVWGPALLDNEMLWMLAQSVGFHWVWLASLALLLRQHGGNWAGVFGMRWRSLLRSAVTGLTFYVVSMPFLFFYALLYQLFLRLLGQDITLQEVALALTEATSPWMRAYFFFMGGVLAPLVEEIFFRGILLPYLAKRLGVSGAILLVSVLFAGIHFHVASLAPLFVLSMAFCLAYIHSRSLWVPIVMHGVFNTVSMVFLLALKEL